MKGKIWRSLDLAHQSNSLNNPNYHPTSVTTASNAIHNSLINATHYQRHDFKNRRSSSEPANEQKMLAHIQATTSSTQNYNTINQNTATAITSNINSHSSCNNNQTNSTSTSNSLVVDDENPSDDFIDCLHQKTIPKVSKPSHQTLSLSLSIFFIL